MTTPALLRMRTRSSDLDAMDAPPAFLPTVALMMVVLLAALRLVPAITPLVFLGLAAYTLRGPMATIQSLTLLFLILNLNPALFHASGHSVSLRWVVLLAAFGRVVWDGVIGNKPWPMRVLNPLLVFVGSCLTIAIVSSRLPVVSAFKLSAFAMGVITVLTSFHRIRQDTPWLFSWFTTFLITMMVISAPLYVHPLGFVSNGRGFQGVMAHPQIFGPIVAPITSWLLVMLIFRGERSPLVLAGVALGLLAVFTSQARTGAFMIAGSVLISGAFALMQGRPKRLKPARPLSPGIALFGVLALLLFTFANAKAIEARAVGWIQKRVDDAASASIEVRATMVDRQFENFMDHPLTGIGFGLPSNADDWARVSTGFLGLPTGFTAEKGFLPSAVLEETGLIGAILLAFLVIGLLRPLIRSRSAPIQALCFAGLLANAGEMVFFSFGGPGLFYWLLLGLGYAQAHVTARTDRS